MPHTHASHSQTNLGVVHEARSESLDLLITCDGTKCNLPQALRAIEHAKHMPETKRQVVECQTSSITFACLHRDMQ